MDPDAAKRTLDQELERGLAVIGQAESLEALERARQQVLGRRSTFSEVQRSLGSFSEEDRRTVGHRANEVRAALEVAIQQRRDALAATEERDQLERDRVDVTLPGRRPRAGSVNPLTATEYEMVDVFSRMGYRVVEGNEVETDWYNFTALNIPPAHPARSEKDTVFLDVPGHDDLLLRTETSAMQIRTMEKQEPPVFVIAPGRVFRQETPDPTHTPVFHQVEGLAVDEGITFADLKGTLHSFAKAMFGEETRVRMTPDFFPFVEPGAQFAVACFLCGGAGCRTCKHTGWIELLGCGMVHPNVLRNVGYDPERYSGFAFGVGIERVAMVRYGVPDIRLFYEGDLRFLEQFASLG
jgi:phenylalanyl-tRNA synthetase alpha chain